MLLVKYHIIWKVFKTNRLKYDIANPLNTAIWDVMAFEIGSRWQI